MNDDHDVAKYANLGGDNDEYVGAACVTVSVVLYNIVWDSLDLHHDHVLAGSMINLDEDDAILVPDWVLRAPRPLGKGKQIRGKFANKGQK